eukprot:SAG11_NODE_31244_length_293_cov_1.329897_1_plen_48_part_10
MITVPPFAGKSGDAFWPDAGGGGDGVGDGPSIAACHSRILSRVETDSH